MQVKSTELAKHKADGEKTHFCVFGKAEREAAQLKLDYGFSQSPSLFRPHLQEFILTAKRRAKICETKYEIKTGIKPNVVYRTVSRPQALPKV